MADVNLGVAGYGIRSRVLLSAVGALEEVNVAAVAECKPEARAAAEQDYAGVKTFDDYIAMLDSGLVNAVLIETPPSTHAQFAVEALQRGIHVLSDVPAVHEIPEGDLLWKAAQTSSAVYSFGATTNWWGFVDTCVDLKAKGLLGKPVYCEAEYVADLGNLPDVTPWRKHYEPIRYCTHSLGPILKWVDEDLAEVSCFDTGSQMHDDPENHDAMVAIFKTKSGTVVKLLTTFINSHPVPFHRYVCYGTNGYFEKTQPFAGAGSQVLCSSKALYGAHGLIQLPVAESRPELEGVEGVGEHGGADYCMLRDFVDSIMGNKPPAVDLRQALRMTLPGLYALESARAGGALTRIRYPWG